MINRRTRWVILGILGAAGAAVVLTVVSLAGGVHSFYGSIPQAIATDGALLLGDWEAQPVVLSVFLDFTDIRSARLYQTLYRLIDPYIRPGEALLAVYLRGDSPGALVAAQAVYCAYRQGGAWPMYDALFGLWERQFSAYGRLQAPAPAYTDLQTIKLAARQIKIDPERLTVCINQGGERETLEAAQQHEVPELPAVYINDVLLRAEPTFEQLQATIEVDSASK